SMERELGRSRLRAALGLTAAVLCGEVAGGFLSRSLALFADAAHLFADIAALTMAYAAMSLAQRAPTGRHSFGLYRAEILAAFVNAQILLVIAIFILFQAVVRIRAPIPIQTGLMFWVAVFGLAANVVSMRLLSGGGSGNLNMRAASMEVLTDLLGSLAVVAAAVAIPRTGWLWLDAAVSAAVGLFILPRSVSLLKQSSHILLEGTPREIDVSALRRRILEVPGVEALHDLHCWTLTSGLHSASVHVRASGQSPRGQVLTAVQSLLAEEAGVDHATIQVEWGAEMTCHSSNRGHA
ncbi:MAG: cation diffusion facilitator family transporter, partial [Thermoanaerobaculia bacterium]